ncbi:MAG: hypothetical protein P8I91_01910 [Phycisphaerales bacterium]|nr:hypothetical protein [Phycisphaerales bacterium]
MPVSCDIVPLDNSARTGTRQSIGSPGEGTGPESSRTVKPLASAHA